MFKHQVNEVDRALKFNRILIDDENAKVKDIQGTIDSLVADQEYQNSSFIQSFTTFSAWHLFSFGNKVAAAVFDSKTNEPQLRLYDGQTEITRTKVGQISCSLLHDNFVVIAACNPQYEVYLFDQRTNLNRLLHKHALNDWPRCLLAVEKHIRCIVYNDLGTVKSYGQTDLLFVGQSCGTVTIFQMLPNTLTQISEFVLQVGIIYSIKMIEM